MRVTANYLRGIKGREKIFFDGDQCRKIWKAMSPQEQKERLKIMKEDIKKELSRK